jgi:cobalt/nickel transport system permease protein
MHMADALISPAVGGVMWAATGALAVYSARQVKFEGEKDARLIPLMGVLGAFVFAAQMLNFSIPLTGSSGHIGGGLLLAALLGPHAAFLTIFSILAVQALFFADGGLLALGCNAFNLGFWPCFVAYSLICQRGLVSAKSSFLRGALIAAAAVCGLQLGAFCVVLQTTFSNLSTLPFGDFLLLMQPIHLAIGLAEGVTTAGIVEFIRSARPEILAAFKAQEEPSTRSLRPVLIGFAGFAVVCGSVFSWFAASNPDGLEWAAQRVSGVEALEPPTGGIHARLAAVQERTALMPDYDFKSPAQPDESACSEKTVAEQNWPAVSAGTSLAGVLGAAITMVIVVLIGLVLRKIRNLFANAQT